MLRQHFYFSHFELLNVCYASINVILNEIVYKIKNNYSHDARRSQYLPNIYNEIKRWPVCICANEELVIGRFTKTNSNLRNEYNKLNLKLTKTILTSKYLIRAQSRYYYLGDGAKHDFYMRPAI